MSDNIITLSDDQEEHFEDVKMKSNDHNVILITTPTGGGKTIIMAEFMRHKNIKHAIVICNGTTHIDHWNKHKIMYNLPITMIISYDTLRGNSTIITPDGKEMCHHGLLYKIGNEYEPTPAFMSYIEEGDFMLILDESHLIKNDCGKTSAVKALSRYITIRNFSIKPPPRQKSWSFYLSMTPFDDPFHVINYVSTCGIVRSNSLFCKTTDRPTGILELYEYCKLFNNDKTEMIWGTSDVKSKSVNDVAYRLVTEVFLRLTSSFVKNCHKSYLSKQSIYYAYFDIDPIGVKLMKKAIEMIKQPVKANCLETSFEQMSLETDEYLSNVFNQITNNNLPLWKDRRGVVHGMESTQTIKTYYIYLGFIDYIFRSIPNVKIVVFLDYKESINLIMRYLYMYNPVKITGDAECKGEIRNKIVSKFNEPNLDSRLLLIINQIGSDGIELDDRDGRFPRVGLNFSDFYHSRLFQCPGRIFRKFTKSNSLFFLGMVNSPECDEESVNRSTSNKSKVMEETLKNNEIISPINFQKIINPHLMDLNELLRNAGNEPLVESKEEEAVAKTLVIRKSSIRKNF